ncbi:MAG: hypothetical protein Q7S22_05685 [Candidatus Micrarchaeota archaeon]|nr:hypothetical protein [Candidatus Micrarchaeota archaeon]
MADRVILPSGTVTKLFLIVFFLISVSNIVSAQGVEDFCNLHRINAPVPGTVSYEICAFFDLYGSWVPIGIMMMIMFAALVYVVGQLSGAETRARAVVWSHNLLLGALFAAIIAFVLSPILTTVALQGIEHPDSGIPSMFSLIYLPVLKSITLCMLITAATYMMAYFFQHPPLSAIAKEELAATIFSVIIVWFWLASNAYLPNLIVGILTAGSPNVGDAIAAHATSPEISVSPHIYLASAALDILFEKMRATYSQLYLFEVLIGFLSTLSFPLGSPLPLVNLVTFSFMPYDGLVLLSNAHTVVVEAIGFVITAIMAKQIILGFARDIIPLIILPLGIVFRAFPMTRKTGSSLIAISFVVFYVYPLSVLFSNYLIFDVYKPADFNYVPKTISPLGNPDPAKIQELVDIETEHKKDELTDEFASETLTEFQVQAACGSGFWGLLCSGKKLISNFGGVLSAATDNIFTIGKFMWSMTSGFVGAMAEVIHHPLSNNPFFPSASTSGLYKFIIDEVVTVSQLIVLIIITSVLEIIFTITMYRNVAAIIGGELEIAGLTKLV